MSPQKNSGQFLFLLKSAASAAAEVCRGSMLFSADSVQESVISQREGTLQCAVIFCFVNAASLHIDGIERGERGREGEQVRSAGCLSAPELPSLALSLSLSLDLARGTGQSAGPGSYGA